MRQLQGSSPRLGPRIMCGWYQSCLSVIVPPPPSDPLNSTAQHSTALRLAEELRQLI